MICLDHCLVLGACLFCIGFYGLLTADNTVRALMCLELLFNSVNINLVAYSSFLDTAESRGEIFVLFVMTIAAAEAAIGLSIVLAVHRARGSSQLSLLSLLRW